MQPASLPHLYAVALGSNRRHGRHGAPDKVVLAALDALAALDGVDVVAAAPLVHSAPLGPAGRQFANTVAILSTAAGPSALLAMLKQVERAFGRRPGRRWGPRVLDLDIILWSGGIWASPDLAIPHPAWRDRGFVLGPLARLAPRWRDPVTGLSVRHFRERLRRG